MRLAWILLMAFVSLLLNMSRDICVAQNARVMVRDSVGTHIVENRLPAWRVGESWSINATPVAQIGTVEGEDPYVFGMISTARRHPEGTVAVVEWASYEIRLFDSSGRHVLRFGGYGGGPGEFKARPAIAFALPDTLVTWDAQQQRLTWFSLEGEVLSDLSLMNPLSGVSLGRPGIGTWQLLPDGTVLSAGVETDPGAEGTQWYRSFDLIHAFGDSVTHIARYPTEWTARVDGRAFAPPFSSTRPGCLGTDHRVYVASADTWEVSVFDRAGRLVELVRAPIPRRPITNEMRSAAREEARKSLGRGGRDARRALRRYDEFEIPDSLPAIREIICDDAGYLWVGRRETYLRRTTRSASVFDTIDAGGRWLGSVDMPSGLDRVLEIRNGFVLAVWKDENEVSFLRIYAIHRPD